MISFCNYKSLEFQLSQKNKIREWLSNIALKNKKEIVILNYIFCSDKELLSINKKHLNHDEYTDIITFDYNEGKLIISDIYISIPRVKENAKLYKQTFQDELCRVMVHGVLHLCGFKDKTEAEKKKMRKKEEEALLIFKGL